MQEGWPKGNNGYLTTVTVFELRETNGNNMIFFFRGFCWCINETDPVAEQFFNPERSEGLEIAKQPDRSSLCTSKTQGKRQSYSSHLFLSRVNCEGS